MKFKKTITGLVTVAVLAAFFSLSTPLGAQKTDTDSDEKSVVEKAVDAQTRLADLIENDLLPAYVFTGSGGSGVLISEDGYFLTNYHVVAGIFERQGREDRILDVETIGGESHRALIVGVDPRGDIALLKMIGEDKKFPHLELGNSDELSVGQYSIAIGNPFAKGRFAAEPTVTFGVISAIHVRQSTYSDAIQTDAPINPGNSGGPLITLDGKLVGINGRIETRFGTRASSGVGFAISSSQIKRFLPILKQGGIVFHGYSNLGIEGKGRGRRWNAENTPEGVKVENVEKDSPEHNAGIRSGDIIVQVGGYNVPNRERLEGIIQSFPANSEVKVNFIHDGEEKEGTLTLGSFGSWESNQILRSIPATDELRGLGAKVVENDGKPAFGNISDDSPAGKAGLKENDIIKKVNGRVVPNKGAAVRMIQSRWKGETVRFEVERDGKLHSVEVQLPE